VNSGYQSCTCQMRAVLPRPIRPTFQDLTKEGADVEGAKASHTRTVCPSGKDAILPQHFLCLWSKRRERGLGGRFMPGMPRHQKPPSVSGMPRHQKPPSVSGVLACLLLTLAACLGCPAIKPPSVSGVLALFLLTLAAFWPF